MRTSFHSSRALLSTDNPILIVDDDTRFGKRLVTYFKRRELYARTVSGPNVARHLIAAMKPAIVIISYSEQVEALCACIRRSVSPTEIILTCDHHSGKTEQKARRLSPAFFFSKPFNEDDLFAVVLRILEIQNQKCISIENGLNQWRRAETLLNYLC
jgi:DNA-binding NtrC family response regulator